MDVAYEDGRLHDDGIFGRAGYREWFHYVGTFSVGGKPLTFMLGFPRSREGTGALGWVCFNGKQYSLAGNKNTGVDKLFDLEARAHVNTATPGYVITYPEVTSGFTGSIQGIFPDYTIQVHTPNLTIEICMTINSLHSVVQRDLSPWIDGGWFHSGDITASLTGTIEGNSITANSNKCWYERNWSKIPLFGPCEWFWFITYLDTGEVFNLLIEKTLSIRVPFLDECWLYQGGTFYTFPRYTARLSRELRKALHKRDFLKIVNEHITCEGKKGKNSFNIQATITDFRQYEFRNWYAHVTWTNFIIETEVTAHINGTTLDMKGRGMSEKTPIQFWL